MTSRIRINYVAAIEGPLYRVMGEDEELHVFDVVFRACCCVTNRIWEHKTHYVRGAHKRPDGFMGANYNYKNEVRSFQDRVEARGTIDPAHWVEVTETAFDLEQALKEEAARERMERYAVTGRVS